MSREHVSLALRLKTSETVSTQLFVQLREDCSKRWGHGKTDEQQCLSMKTVLAREHK